MNIVLLGPPGTGKGTQAERIAAKRGMAHLSTGDMVREEIKRNTALGKKLKSIADRGGLAPDDVVTKMLETEISGPDCGKGFILEGFPRTFAQAQALERIMKRVGGKPDVVINIVVSDDSAIKRIAGRRVCSRCGAGYNMVFKPPKKYNLCDKCGSALEKRSDDSEESIRKRLKIYKERTEPIIGYYRNMGLLVDVNGEKSIENVSAEIEEKIRSVVLHGV